MPGRKRRCHEGPERKPITGYLWAGLAVLSCPCHLPILAVVLVGTTTGALLSEHLGIAALGLIGSFVLSLSRASRAFRSTPFNVFEQNYP
ncbi:broad-spectrum mercury transporter MerE [Herbaspirillum chlorophenolicum]|uniref:broad-spectrum mercury transporter MerE n=1 Tax=Herbaspirillum chlorophenolicum TaxID=211589 RepID=UPI0009E234EA|nr:broad-spectrum mercury transporter MerE [Herbaspirillum chlorophenolicum]